MTSTHLLHDLPAIVAGRAPDAPALRHNVESLSYGELQTAIEAFAAGLLALGVQRGDRVALYLEKRFEAAIASFGCAAAGTVFVPLNPLLKPAQVGYILRDSGARVLVTSPERLALLLPVVQAAGPTLRHVVVTESAAPPGAVPDAPASLELVRWTALLAAPPRAGHRTIDTDIAAILYTSGSTGSPKGVVLSHRNLVAGARSVATYLGNHAGDTLLAALPLSFDAGFSQLTTAFAVGAQAVLLTALVPRDVLRAIAAERITGLTAVPPLFIQLAALDWPAEAVAPLRYFANTGGRLPRETLEALRRKLPHASPFLMYGLTEAFRSTYLPPAEVDRRPDSIGRAIPNAEVLVLRDDGTECAADEPGELVHRGALVALGYWGDRERTAERFRPLPPGLSGRPADLPLPELAVFSGDTVRRDAEGFLYFVGRRDEMIKSSGYRVSPTEIEETVYATGLVGECIAFGVEHAALGQAIHVIATAPDGSAAVDVRALLSECKQRLPAYMVPVGIATRPGPLPRNPNGKIDRPLLRAAWREPTG